VPIKDDEKRRAYFRDLMRKRRAATKREPKPLDDEALARREHRKAVKARREERQRQEAAERVEREINRPRCRLCWHLPSAQRIIVTHEHERFCEHCITLLARMVAAARTDQAERAIKRCSFCGKVRGEVRTMVAGLDHTCICDECRRCLKASREDGWHRPHHRSR
jgi:hypothetical protein